MAVADFTAGTSESPVTRTLYIYKDVTLGTADNSSIAVPKYATLNIVPQADVKLTRGTHKRGNRWFLVNDNSQTLNIGSDTYSLTIEDDGSTIICNTILRREAGIMTVKNVTFNNIKFGDGNTSKSEYGYIYSTKNNTAAGYCSFMNVTVSNCSTTTSDASAFLSSQVTTSDALYLQGSINFNNCTGTDIYAAARIRLGEINGSSSTTITASTPISIYWANATTAITTNVVVKATAAMVSNFTLTNENLGLFGNNTDLKLTQAYTLSIGEAGAATLVLPFESTIPTTPSVLTCYKLTYDGGDNIVATAEQSTLGANKPVLVMGTASTSYKFVSTATSGDAATGIDQTSANGVLIGNYTDSWTVPTTTGDNPNYILQNKNSGLGFYKVVENRNTLSPYRAYMSVKHNNGGSSSAPAFFSLDFNGMNGTTGISITSREETTRNNDGVVYNLNGVRMNGENLPKGIYVKNGRKFIVK